MSRNPSGWQRRAQGQIPEVPEGPPGFDKLLSELGISEQEAAKHPSVRSWVRKHYRDSFVPEKILEAVGVREAIL
jgi:hypothetical protein